MVSTSTSSVFSVTTLLVISRHHERRHRLCDLLRELGASVLVSATADDAEMVVRSGVLDGVLIEGDPAGLSAELFISRARSLKKGGVLPLVYLSATQAVPDTKSLFRSGADDCLPSFIGNEELLRSRLGTLLRRYLVWQRAQQEDLVTPDEQQVRVGPITIRPDRFQVLVEGRTIDVTPTEFRLLVLLAKTPNRVFSREQILQKVFTAPGEVSVRAVDSHVFLLRKKLGRAGHCLRTVRGFGYQLVDDLPGW